MFSAMRVCSFSAFWCRWVIRCSTLRIYNNEVVREVDTAIVDLSHSHSSREFIRDYDASPDAKATYYCNSLDEAKELVRRQAVHGILYFPADFDTKLNRGEQAHVGVYCDMSLMLTYKAIYYTLRGRSQPHQLGHPDNTGWRIYG